MLARLDALGDMAAVRLHYPEHAAALVELGKAYLDIWSIHTGDGACWEEPLRSTMAQFEACAAYKWADAAS